MLAFLALVAERINAAHRGSLEFNFDGDSFKPSLHEHYPRIRLTVDLPGSEGNGADAILAVGARPLKEIQRLLSGERQS